MDNKHKQDFIRQLQAVMARPELWCIVLVSLIVLMLATGCASRLTTKQCVESTMEHPQGTIRKTDCQVIIQESTNV